LLRLVPYGPAALDALVEAIAEAKAGDLLAPVTVAVPSNYAGLSIRGTLARRAPIVNVRFLVLSRVAELLGAPLLAKEGRTPLGTWMRTEAIRAVLREAPGVFADVAEHPATERALGATFKDLRGLDGPALARIAARGPRQGDTARLYTRFLELTAGFYDETDLIKAAAQAVQRRSPAEGDLGHVIAHLLEGLGPAETALLSALGRRQRASAIFGLTGDAAADQSTRAAASTLAWGLGDLEETSPAVVETATGVASVTDPEEELRLVMRMLAGELEAGAPLHRTTILYRNKEPYALLAHELLHAAGIPHNGPAVQTLAQTVYGRTLLGALQLAVSDFARDEVMEWLTGAPILEPGGGPAPAQRWDVVSKEAGVVSGSGQWKARLGVYAAKLRRRASEQGEEDGSLAARIAQDAEVAERLARFVGGLGEALSVPGKRSAGELATWIMGVLDQYLGRMSGWPREGALSPDVQTEIDAERAAREAIEEQLGQIVRFDEAATTPAALRARYTLAEFTAAVAQLLEAPAGRIGGFGEGVFVGPLSAAAGMNFDHVYVVGLVEGQLPPVGHEDPLLSDDDRRQAGAEMPLRVSRRADERRQYLAALSSAPKQTLLFPRADLRGQSGNLPSRWLLESASRLAGERLYSRGFSELGESAGPWFSLVPSFQSALAGSLEPASEQEFDLRGLLRAERQRQPHWLRANGAELDAGIQAARARMPRRRRRGGHDGQLSRFDGGIGADLAVRPSSQTPASATSIETFARCPFRYFVGNVLRVREVEKPEDVLRISAADKGTLMHEALERFFEEMQASRPDALAPWTQEERDRLAAIGSECCDAAEVRGITGRDLLWRVDRGRIIRDLVGFLDADEQWRLDTGFVFEAAELTFGMPAAGGRTAHPPATVALADGHVVAFRGKIDRVDRAADGRLAVFDYKSGSKSTYEPIEKATGGERLDGGKHLQLPIYAVAAASALGATGDVGAYYRFLSEREQYAKIGYPVTEEERDALRDTLGVLVGTMGAGLFPANPGERDRNTYQNCRFCAYDSICQGGDRVEAWVERQRADGLDGYVLLAEGAVAEGDRS
jgi:RecB family exonuclease